MEKNRFKNVNVLLRFVHLFLKISTLGLNDAIVYAALVFQVQMWLFHVGTQAFKILNLRDK